MIDKKPHIKPYLYGMLAGFGAISLSIIFFFLIYRFDGFGDAISTLTGILMPFIYGAVIAYLLKPVCNTIEGLSAPVHPGKDEGPHQRPFGDLYHPVRASAGLRPVHDDRARS